MEALFHSLIKIPVGAVNFQGLSQLVLITATVIFKLMIPKPYNQKILKPPLRGQNGIQK
jgi:hypothetical protein